MPQAVCLSPSVPVLYTSRSVIVKSVVSRDLSLNDLMLVKTNEWVMASYSVVASGKRCTGLREQAGGQCLVGSLPPPYDGLAPPRLFPSNFPMGPPWADVPLPPPKDTPRPMIQAPSGLHRLANPPPDCVCACVASTWHRDISVIIRCLVPRWFFIPNLKCAMAPPGDAINDLVPLHERGSWRQDIDQGHSRPSSHVKHLIPS